MIESLKVLKMISNEPFFIPGLKNLQFRKPQYFIENFMQLLAACLNLVNPSCFLILL